MTTAFVSAASGDAHRVQGQEGCRPSKAAPSPLRQKNNDNLAGNLADYDLARDTRCKHFPALEAGRWAGKAF
ncbi:MAG: hypothetical protein ACXWMY_19610 [Vulcanimicrobiaceae bacterium]